ncbi:MAG: hypothetical protein A2508_08660 [Candidatus Lambdaproteobacteria bacterium RIFOXYD12_FULL_49_8]|uniref:histidine kinase n=1 Tax=Candidatus Lambdaproteobacteria bacterium RIFOXYD2_FULL_50_16 TaxID=1817772 RepID=A0A1F6GAE2_9PROT|nr:MAG: hypothetical protein A2527_07855 [Candidatus Lambdaproteobacteria bacterium RIFOXYD2_FULL_50_16]OGG98006.1 MAG: hypothetical protein A2508_08660 [Candidatus Lambdaproteobacteria bacterium RIFOXYD12_FULL_49_8]
MSLESASRATLLQKITELEAQIESGICSPQLQKVQKKVDDLLQLAHMGIWTLDRRGQVLFVSPEGAQMLGQLPEKILGRSFFELIPSLDQSRIRQELLYGTATEKKLEFELNHWLGNRIHLAAQVLPLIVDGNLAGYQLVCFDLTESYRNRQNLAQSEARWQALVEQSPNLIISLDRDLKINFMNPAVSALDPAVWTGCSVLDLFKDLGQRAVALHKMETAWSTGFGSRFNLHFNPNQEVEIDFEIRAVPGTCEGRVTSVTLTGIDVTAYNSALKHLSEAKLDAEVAAQAKTNFLANMGHELRTPLNGILGVAQLLLLDPYLRGEKREWVKIIQDSGESLLDILRNVLDLSRIDADRLHPRIQIFETQEVGAKLERLFKVAATQAGLSLKCSLDPELPKFLLGDPFMLDQVLTNLIGNAIKFTKKGGVEYKIKRLEGDGDQCLVRFEVLDQGQGIAESQFEAIFEPFRQVDQGITRNHQGAGLGLAIAQKLVGLMGGKLQMESELEVGSRFWFELPFKIETTQMDPPLVFP